MPTIASAQIPVGLAADLLVNGARAGSKAIKNRANKPGEFVNYFKAGADSIAQKRTPENKLRGAASTDIRELEQYLTSANAEYRQPNREFSFDGSTASIYIQRIRSQQPKWDVAPYEQEARFYTQESRKRYAAARQREQETREMLQRKAAARQDSVYRLAQRRQQVADSLREVALVRISRQQDSIAYAVQQRAQLVVPVAAVAASAIKPSVTRASTSAKPAHSVKRPTAKPVVARSGGVVYMCNSGNTGKYHASPSCRGLGRCNASIVKISKSEAQASMDPCKFCY